MTLPLPPYRLHPVAVHFPIALLTTGLAACAAGLVRREREPRWLPAATSWLLWLGTAGAWAALGLGLLAEETAPHVPPAWRALNAHENLAYWTVGLFTLLSVWRVFLYRESKPELPAFLLCWLAAALVLAATGWFGGEVAFTYGMGVGDAAAEASPGQ